MVYRYVVHLEDGESRRTIRWTFAHPVSESQVLDLPTLGRWYVKRVVTGDVAGAGVVYCAPFD